MHSVTGRDGSTRKKMAAKRPAQSNQLETQPAKRKPATKQPAIKQPEKQPEKQPAKRKKATKQPTIKKPKLIGNEVNTTAEPYHFGVLNTEEDVKAFCNWMNAGIKYRESNATFTNFLRAHFIAITVTDNIVEILSEKKKLADSFFATFRIRANVAAFTLTTDIIGKKDHGIGSINHDFISRSSKKDVITMKKSPNTNMYYVQGLIFTTKPNMDSIFMKRLILVLQTKNNGVCMVNYINTPRKIIDIAKARMAEFEDQTLTMTIDWSVRFPKSDILLWNLSDKYSPTSDEITKAIVSRMSKNPHLTAAIRLKEDMIMSDTWTPPDMVLCTNERLEEAKKMFVKEEEAPVEEEEAPVEEEEAPVEEAEAPVEEAEAPVEEAEAPVEEEATADEESVPMKSAAMVDDVLEKDPAPAEKTIVESTLEGEEDPAPEADKEATEDDSIPAEKKTLAVVEEEEEETIMESTLEGEEDPAPEADKEATEDDSIPAEKKTLAVVEEEEEETIMESTLAGEEVVMEKKNAVKRRARVNTECTDKRPRVSEPRHQQQKKKKKKQQQQKKKKKKKKENPDTSGQMTGICDGGSATFPLPPSLNSINKQPEDAGVDPNSQQHVFGRAGGDTSSSCEEDIGDNTPYSPNPPTDEVARKFRQENAGNTDENMEMCLKQFEPCWATKSRDTELNETMDMGVIKKLEEKFSTVPNVFDETRSASDYANYIGSDEPADKQSADHRRWERDRIIIEYLKEQYQTSGSQDRYDTWAKSMNVPFVYDGRIIHDIPEPTDNKSVCHQEWERDQGIIEYLKHQNLWFSIQNAYDTWVDGLINAGHLPDLVIPADFEDSNTILMGIGSPYPPWLPNVLRPPSAPPDSFDTRNPYPPQEVYAALVRRLFRHVYAAYRRENSDKIPSDIGCITTGIYDDMIFYNVPPLANNRRDTFLLYLRSIMRHPLAHRMPHRYVIHVKGDTLVPNYPFSRYEDHLKRNRIVFSAENAGSYTCSSFSDVSSTTRTYV